MLYMTGYADSEMLRLAPLGISQTQYPKAVHRQRPGGTCGRPAKGHAPHYPPVISLLREAPDGSTWSKSGAARPLVCRFHTSDAAHRRQLVLLSDALTFEEIRTKAKRWAARLT